MAIKVEKWRSDDGSLHDSELEAVKADAKLYKARIVDLERSLNGYRECNNKPRSSYGSSGGGGHD